MKQVIVLLSVMYLFFTAGQAANYVEIGLGDVCGNTDTIVWGCGPAFTISIENDIKLGGISLPFRISSPDGVVWVLYDDPVSQFAPATPNGGTFITGVPGSRWMSGAAEDGSCWNLGGTLINDALAPNQFLVGGASFSDAGLEPGPLEHMLNVHFTPHGETFQIRTLCIDSAFYPPAGQFIFDPGGRPYSNLPRCWPVVQFASCPTWDEGNPTSMSMENCSSGQVTVTATGHPSSDGVHYYLWGTTGDGTAIVGLESGVVTYTPVPSDAGQTIQIEVAATHPLFDPRVCQVIWVLDVTVTNTAPTIDCGLPYNIAAHPNLMTKSDIAVQDADTCDDAVYFVRDITPLPNGSYAMDPATGEFTFTPAENDFGYYAVCVGGTDGADTATCCFDIDVWLPDDCPGDVTRNCLSNVADAVFLINYIFKGGPPPDVMNWADVNADCVVNIADAVYIIQYVFQGGPEPQLGCVYQ